MSDPKDVLRRILEDGVRKLGGSGEVHSSDPEPEHGDWSTNVALQLAKDLKRKPREIAEDLKKAPPMRSSKAASRHPRRVDRRAWFL